MTGSIKHTRNFPGGHNSQPPGKFTDDKFPPPCKKCMQIPGGVAGGMGNDRIDSCISERNY